MSISLPFNFTPRPYQLPVFRAFDSGAKRLVSVWHRRSGKEKTYINLMARETARRVGNYFYCFPTYAQGKKAIWEGFDKDGFPFLGHFPKEYIKHKDDSELKLTLASGSIFRVVGTDRIDALMSTNPIGIVFAEYSLQDPAAWDMMRPILLENNGWAAFDFTPRGKNHGYKIYETAMARVAEKDPNWFCSKLSITDTGALTEAQVDEERRNGMDEELIQQEYYCSFIGVQSGSYYGKEMELCEAQGRICNVPYEEDLPVDTWWDLGVDDCTSIWFTQNVGRAVHVIDYLEASGEGLPFYARELTKKPYIYGTHNAPHDIRVRELGSGKSRIETARALGINFKIVPNIPVQDGISAVRTFLRKCYFDRDRTERGRLGLTSYHKVYDQKRQCFQSSPYHDWSSNPSDSFRYLSIGHKTANPRILASSLSSGILPASQPNTPSASWLST